MISFSAIYVAIALTHFLVQVFLACCYRQGYSRQKLPPTAKILVLIPGYREGIKEIEETIESCVASCSYLPPGYRHQIVYIEDDADHPRLLPLKLKYSKSLSVDIVVCGSNIGKRHAQYFGYRWAVNELKFSPDYVVTVDSDTRLEQNAICSMLQQFRPTTGAVTGNVAICNASTLLQKLIALRYWLAFNTERASQSVFGEVLCCSGPLTAYSGAVWQKVMPDYLNQYFLGERCTFGDDRRLTALVLKQGLKTQYDYKSLCYTEAPRTLWKYIKQQTRWARSFFRESLLMFTESQFLQNGKVRWYALWEVFVAIILPLLLFLNLAGLFLFHWSNPWIFVSYVGVIICTAFLRSAFGLLFDDVNPRFWYLFFPLFALLNLVILFPIRIRALFTLTGKGWGTR